MINILRFSTTRLTNSMFQPLNPNPDSKWRAYFKDNEMLLQIDKDCRYILINTEYEMLMDKAFTNNNELIILGDFNRDLLKSNQAAADWMNSNRTYVATCF